MSENTADAANRVPAHGLSRVQTLIIAVAAGMSVANIYYAQPLLDLMAHDLGISSSSVGLVVTLTQVGYGLGLILSCRSPISPTAESLPSSKGCFRRSLLSSWRRPGPRRYCSLA